MIRIAVDPKRALGSLDRRIFGGFIEHLGRCIYGGIYDEGSARSDERGFRSDVLALLRDLDMGVLRWPGGNFASNYHWQDGVGPRAGRPVRSELAWGGTDTNRFGTDEYIEYCRALGVEPYICLNMGTGSLEEALAWVEYCNSERPTDWADRRRANGHQAPHRVRLWGLGNEVYGRWQVGALSADEYIAEATRWAAAIRMIDPDVELVVCGETGWTDWDVQVATGLVGVADLYSVHLYTGAADHWTNVLAPLAAERAIRTTAALLGRAAYAQGLDRVPRIAYDEWNVWWREMQGGLEERFVFHDALAVGTYLNVFVRNCAWVRMANLAQMVNAIAPVVTTEDAVAVQPIYYPVLLHSAGHLTEAVDAHVEGPAVPVREEWISRWPHRVDDLGPFSPLDVAATVDRDRSKLAVTVVNRSEHDEAVELLVRDRRLVGPAQLKTVTAGGPLPPIPGIEAATVTEGTEEPAGGSVTVTLPGSSFTLIEAVLS
jgi:alpha-N-arabinofuranosidase